MHKLAGLGRDTPTHPVGTLPLRSQLTRLSLPRRASESSLSSESSESSDAGLCMDSPSPMDSQMAEQMFEQAIQAASRAMRNDHFSIRRFQSLPVRLLGHSPVLRNITNSQALDRWSKSEAGGRTASGPEEDKENEGFVFKMPWKPTGPGPAHGLAEWASRREAFTQRPSSAPNLMQCLTPEQKMEVEELSPMAPSHRLSLSPAEGAAQEDDGFVDILESDLKEDDAVPPGMESLISAPLVKTLDKEEEQDLIMFSKCQRLFRSPSMPCSVIRPILKRLERPQDRDTPVQSKRRRSVTLPEEQQQPEEPKARVLRSKSLCHDEIESILDSDHRGLIGDYSKPLFPGRLLPLALLGLLPLPQLYSDIHSASAWENISTLMSNTESLPASSQAWQSLMGGSSFTSFFIYLWEVVPWVSASWVLWEPELTFKAKAVWPLGLGGKDLFLPGSWS
ncbi:M-phase inducer phosphatase 2 isoform X5 [Fukomys damarensis]|uniref:M-phase inducer phosphatase 2 isoform X5 n=1 Tax=Fukomys damarensis TaxID=885580 RepID=UPI00053F7EFA|nr:M-phase inducer phosphatase 2 isoform X5 [Fukomys damarensis]